MGTDVQLLGDFDREATQDEQDAIVDQTRAVETLYDDIPYTVDQARITDDVESPTRAKYHGRQDSTVQVSLRSMEMDDIELRQARGELNGGDEDSTSGGGG